MDLFFGSRHPDSDFYYRDEIGEWRADARLAEFTAAFSRHDGKTYVQDRVREHAGSVAERLRNGATVMVCGSARMAHAVSVEIDSIAQTIGTSVAELKMRGRYLEDTY